MPLKCGACHANAFRCATAWYSFQVAAIPHRGIGAPDSGNCIGDENTRRKDFRVHPGWRPGQPGSGIGFRDGTGHRPFDPFP